MGRLDERIEEIKNNDRAYWFGIGDMGDHIYYTDPRFTILNWSALEAEDMQNALIKHIRKIADKFEPIKDKCLGYGRGNHEKTVNDKYHVDPTQEVCDRLGLKNIGYSSLATLTFRRPLKGGKRQKSYTVRIYMHHGFGGGRTHGAQINKVEGMISGYGADIYAMGHVHGKVASKPVRIETDHNGNKVRRKLACLVTSSYVNIAEEKTTGYAERLGFREADLTAPTVRFRWKGTKHDFEPEILM
jgi:hypothetical protein